MVITERSQWFKLLVTMRGSVLPTIRWRLLLVTVISVLVAWFYEQNPQAYTANLTPLPFTLVGLALSIFLGFRNNTSYDRFWEGRKLWGRMVNSSRTFARQVLALVDGAPREPTARQRRLVLAQAGYVHALRARLRNGDAAGEAQPFLPQALHEAVARSTNPPIRILDELERELAEASREGALHPFHLPALDRTLAELTDIQGGCERIKATPIPFAYTVLMHRIVAAYCVALPFGIVTSVGPMTPLVVALVSYAFFGLDAIGDEIEEPFGLDENDLPLDHLSKMIERDLRSALDEPELPEPHPVVKGVLT